MKINESISMSIPQDFRPMTNDEIADRYFTTKRPMALFTDPSLTADLGVNKSITNWAEKDIEIMKSFQKSSIYSLYDNINMLSEGIQEVNGRKFAYFEFVSSVKDEDNAFVRKGDINKYTYIQYAIINGQSLVFNFTCPSRNKDMWQEKVGQIMKSIELKKNLK
ncbi:MAG: hypothetical protein NWS46_06710 [Cyclobacteriaceae bacterium]|jgi:hypothetical protein|nr:hypothetical protein [Cyclobacteriaceae bacterium]